MYNLYLVSNLALWLQQINKLYLKPGVQSLNRCTLSDSYLSLIIIYYFCLLRLTCRPLAGE